MLYYITGNKEKILMAEKQLKPFGISFQAHSIPLVEIQSDSIDEITKDKAQKAYSQLKQPLLVNDHGWSILGLNGFPGPFMKYMNEWLTPQNFLTLTKDLDDRRIILTEVICYIDENQTKLFSYNHEGSLLKEIKGTNPPAMTLTTFDGKKSVAEYFDNSKDPFEKNPTWEMFAEWYKSKQLNT